MSYPVLSVLDLLQTTLEDASTVILEAPPGAGKSTILPLRLLDAPWLSNKKILLLEPRRLAARTVARRMAQLLGEDVGKTVGYRVRFENRTSSDTRLEVVTEGILTRMIQRDNALEETGLILFDEFHERSLHTDLAFVLARQVQQILRPDLRILIMSATLDGDRLSGQISAPVIRAEGRQYPVKIQYMPDFEEDALPVRVARAVKKAVSEQPGDVLVFLPGVAEIKRTMALLEEEPLSVVLRPLYGDLDFSAQQEAIVPDVAGRRKVVLATSIAETSLTIEGIHTVVDSGYSRVPLFDPRSGFTRLHTVRVTADSAEQRAGRAGRLGPGICYRLWSEGMHRNLVKHRDPEILGADLASMVLELYAWGARDIYTLEWITEPPRGPIGQAVDLLRQLDAVDDNGITERGRKMLQLPAHPRLAHMLLEANSKGETALGADIAALLDERDPLSGSLSADLTLRIEGLRKWRKGEGGPNAYRRIERLASSWRRMFGVDETNDVVSDTEVGRWLMNVYPERLARQTHQFSERYKLANGRMGRLPENDPLHRHVWIVVAHIDARGNEGKIFLAAPIDESDFEVHAQSNMQVYWDADHERVVAVDVKRIGALVVSSKPARGVPDNERIKVIVDTIRSKGLSFLNWCDKCVSWQARVMSLRQWRSDEPWPDVSDEALLQTLEEWLVPFLNNANKRSELLKIDLNKVLSTLLPWELSSRLDVLAPDRLTVPSGSAIRLQYFGDGRPPVMEVRLQEVFGLTDSPLINEGRTRVMMHLLSPGFKPVQVTQDLKSFWTNTYAEVRKELRGRYPKHSWPEDPWTAEAVRGVRRRH